MIIWLPIILARSLIVSRVSILIDTLLSLFGAYYIWLYVPLFGLQTVWYKLPEYIVYAVAFFFVSVGITSNQPFQYLKQLFQQICRWGNNNYAQVAWWALLTALFEETVWRIVFQTMLSISMGTYASIVIVALSFSVVHRPRTNGFSVQFIELLLFALVLGFVFCLTHDLLAVITIHFLRNFLVGIKGQAHEG